MNYFLKDNQIYAFPNNAPNETYKSISPEEAKRLAASYPIPKTPENIKRTIAGLIRDINELRKGMDWEVMEQSDKDLVMQYYQKLSQGRLPKTMPSVMKKLGFCEDCYLG